MPAGCSAERWRICSCNIHKVRETVLMTQTQKYLRVYIRIQAALLCLILGTFGACLAAQRTRYIADGAPVSAHREQALPDAVSLFADRLPDKSVFRQAVPYLAALPAPLGCAAGALFSALEFAAQAFSIEFVNIDKK